MTKLNLNGIISLMQIPLFKSPNTIIRGILGSIYPPRCQVCGKGLDLFSENILCENCYGDIKLNTPSGYKNEFEPNICYFDASYSVCTYEGAIRECLHNFKYSCRFATEKLFKGLMVEFAEQYIDIHRFDWLIPVPLYRTKQRERSFNQSAILAACLSKRFKRPMLKNNLLRTRAGTPQIMLPKYKRLKDIKGSFRIKNPVALEEKVILLIDDVFTTGATVNECSKVIKEAGAKSVEVFTLARGA